MLSATVAILLGFWMSGLVGPSKADAKSVATGWNNTNITWFDHANGLAEAGRTGKPILLVAHTTWCPHCERYKKLFFEPRVVELSKHFVMVMLDRDVEKELNAKIGPNGQFFVPRTVFLKADGQVRHEIVGSRRDYPNYIDYGSPAELLRVMQAAK